MSITAALYSASSGLGVAGRAAQVISNNVANALTPGYGARQIVRTSGQIGGVQITTISRRETLSLVTDRRISEAAMGGAQARQSAMASISRIVGSADDSFSLTGRFAALSARLIEAQSRPDSDVRLGNLQAALGDLVGHINAIGEAVQSERRAADSAIATGVETLNTTLEKVHDLNIRISAGTRSDQDINALLDQRRVAIDRIADLIPIREIPRDNGSVSLITQSGKVILDTRPAEFTFTATNGMSPAMVNGGPLSGLKINGLPVDTARSGNPISGGKMAEFFTLRDETLPNVQAQIDSVARNLIERLQADPIDTTTTSGAPGLLTDDGLALGATPAAGLAQRLTVNSAIDPGQGGSLYRLRDGLGASAPGNSGDASLLNRLADALDARSTPSDASLTSASLNAGGMIDSMLAAVTGAAFQAEIGLTEAAGRHDTMLQSEQAEGVNVDDEMRQLLLVEQSYAANARVIEVAGSMIQRLLEI